MNLFRKPSFISIMLLFAGIVVGSVSMYFAQISTSANKTTKPVSSLENFDTDRSLSDGNTGLNYKDFQHVHNHYPSTTSLEDPVLIDNVFERRLAVYSFVASLSLQELKKELQNISGTAQNLAYEVFQELQIALMERMAILDPEAVIEFVVESEEPFSTDTRLSHSEVSVTVDDNYALMPVVQNLFSDWAIADLRSAIDTAKSLDTDAKRNALIGILATLTDQSLAIHRRIAKELGDEEQGINFYMMSLATKRVMENPNSAWTEVESLFRPNNYYHVRALKNIARLWYEQDGFAVLHEVDTSALDENVKSDIVLQLLTQAVEDSPKQAFQFCLTMPIEDHYSSTISSVVRTWATLDPQAAYSAVSGIDKRGDREILQRNVLWTWARIEPHYFLDNLESFPPAISEYAIDDAIRSIANNSPKEAAELVLKYVGEEMDDHLPSVAMEAWVEQDVEAAIDWVYSSAVRKTQRPIWVSAINMTLMNVNPRRAFELAVKEAIPEDSVYMGIRTVHLGLEADVIRYLSRHDLALAVELLPKVREGRTQRNAHITVGRQFIEIGDSKKALDLGFQRTDEDQAEYFRSISWTWASVDPAGLVESIKDFPSEEIRRSVASSLSRGSSRKNFTDAQLETLKQYLGD